MKNDSIIRGCSLHWQIGLLERNLRVHLVFCTWCAKKKLRLAQSYKVSHFKFIAAVARICFNWSSLPPFSPNGGHPFGPIEFKPTPLCY